MSGDMAAWVVDSTVERGAAPWPAPYSNRHSLLKLPAGGRRGHRRSPHGDLDLLRLRFLFLRDGQRQHAVLIVGLDRFRIHGVLQRKASSEEAVRDLHTQVVV